MNFNNKLLQSTTQFISVKIVITFLTFHSLCSLIFDSSLFLIDIYPEHVFFHVQSLINPFLFQCLTSNQHLNLITLFDKI